MTAPHAVASGSTADQTYVVVYKQGASTGDASALVQRSGGTLVANWSKIGVVIARSSSPRFVTQVRAANNVESASSTAGLGVKVAPDSTDAGPLPGSAPANSGSETLAPLQWDMRQIHAFDAHAISGGSPNVVVG